MNAFFSPAAALMGRLRFPTKFAVTGALFTTVLLVIAFQALGALNHRLAQLRAEHSGAELVADLVEWNRALLDFRRAATTAHPAGTDVKALLHDLASQRQALLARIDEDTARDLPLFDVRERSAGLRKSWESLLASLDGLPVDASFPSRAFAAHTAAFEYNYNFMREVGDRSGLALDPDIDLFYLGYPLANNVAKIAGLTVRVRAFEGVNMQAGTLTMADRVVYEVLDSRLKDAVTSIGVMLTQSMDANPQVRERLQPLVAALQEGSTRQLAFAREHFTNAERITVTQADIDAGSKDAVAAAWALVEGTQQTFLAQLEARKITVQGQRLVLATAVLGCLAASIYLFIGMYLSIAEALGALTSGSARLAKGDFRTPVRVISQDELGDVGEHFNAMSRSLGQLVTGIMASAESVLQAADRLAASAVTLADGSRVQASAAQSTASAVEEVSASIKNVAHNVHEAVDVSQAAASAAEDGRKVILAAAAETRTVADLVGQLATDVTRLGSRADEIGAIVHTIQRIADQTNLLALNAAIEAARAGETGRGFAVVADEVRKLAEGTRRATQDIGGMITKVQQDVKASIDQASASQDRVLKGVEMTESATVSLDRIREGSDTTVARIREIAEASEEQAQASDDIARNVEQISQMSEDNDHAIAGIRAAASALQGLAADVKRSVSAFQVA